jgi:hypothetical protein
LGDEAPLPEGRVGFPASREWPELGASGLSRFFTFLCCRGSTFLPDTINFEVQQSKAKEGLLCAIANNYMVSQYLCSFFRPVDLDMMTHYFFTISGTSYVRGFGLNEFKWTSDLWSHAMITCFIC